MEENNLESNLLLDIYFYQKELENAKTKSEQLEAQENIDRAEQLLMEIKSNF